MEIKQIITIILIVVSSVTGAFFKSYFDRLFAQYNPDTKKINSGIRKILFFIFKYLIPTGIIIFTFMYFKTVDKYFVFFVCASFFIITMFLFVDILTKILNVIKNQFQISSKNIEKTNEILNNLTK